MKSNIVTRLQGLASHSWSVRRKWAEETIEYILTHPDDAEAFVLLRKLAEDPKWEVRKAIADGMIKEHLPQQAFDIIRECLSEDSNSFVHDRVHHEIKARQMREERAKRASAPLPLDPLIEAHLERARSLEERSELDAAKRERSAADYLETLRPYARSLAVNLENPPIRSAQQLKDILLTYIKEERPQTAEEVVAYLEGLTEGLMRLNGWTWTTLPAEEETEIQALARWVPKSASLVSIQELIDATRVAQQDQDTQDLTS